MVFLDFTAGTRSPGGSTCAAPGPWSQQRRVGAVAEEARGGCVAETPVVEWDRSVVECNHVHTWNHLKDHQTIGLFGSLFYQIIWPDTTSNGWEFSRISEGFRLAACNSSFIWFPSPGLSSVSRAHHLWLRLGANKRTVRRRSQASTERSGAAAQLTVLPWLEDYVGPQDKVSYPSWDRTNMTSHFIAVLE